MLIAPSPGAPRPHKRVQWKEWAGTKKRPPSLTAIKNKVVYDVENRRGVAWDHIRRHACVGGYSVVRRNKRERTLRSDGAASMLALLTTLLGMVDLKTGFIGSPAAAGAGGSWKRFTLKELAKKAFGSDTDADCKRARDAITLMRSLKWIRRARQINLPKEPGNIQAGFKGEPAVRWLNMDKLADACGLRWLLKRDRDYLDGKKKAAIAPAPPPADEIPFGAKRQTNVVPIRPEERSTGSDWRPSKPADPDKVRRHFDEMSKLFL